MALVDKGCYSGQSITSIDAIGFIHYEEKSKRHQTITQIKKLASAVPNHIDKVCVMVNPDLTTIEHVLSDTSINTIQLHGTESIDFIQEIKKKYSSIKITKALAADENIIQNINKYKGFVDLFIIRHTLSVVWWYRSNI